MAQHENIGQSNEWYTPKYLFDAMNVQFDIDVCSPIDISLIHTPANQFICKDSLNTGWNGGSSKNFVWMNPPFGGRNGLVPWIERFVRNGNGVALVPDRTSAPWWQYFASNADACLFVSGKIKFIRPDGTLGKSPSTGTTLFAIGLKGVNALLLAESNGLGKFVSL